MVWQRLFYVKIYSAITLKHSFDLKTTQMDENKPWVK